MVDGAEVLLLVVEGAEVEVVDGAKVTVVVEAFVVGAAVVVEVDVVVGLSSTGFSKSIPEI